MSDWRIKLGIVDIPSQQAQIELEHDFDKDGNIALFSSPGMGKSTFLQTLTMDLVRQKTPEQLHLYLMDFGTNGLLPLKNLPHVADSFLPDEDEKLVKFMDRIQGELKQRKQLLSAHSASNLAIYEQITGKEIPRIFLLLDSYETVREMKLVNELDNFLQQVAREGLSVGIQVMMTAGRFGTMRAQLISNFKTRISLKQTDDTDVKSIVGRTAVVIDDIPGRGVISLEEPELFQLALPVKAETDVAIIEKLQLEADAMNHFWSGPVPKAIPVMPDELTFEEFITKGSVQDALSRGQIPLGLDFKDVESVGVSFEKLKTVFALADNEDSLTTLTTHLLETFLSLSHDSRVMLVDSEQHYGHYRERVSSYLFEEESLKTFGPRMVRDMEERFGKPYDDLKAWFVIIPNLMTFLSQTGITADEWNKLFDVGYKVKLFFIVGGLYQQVGTTGDNLVKKVRTETQYVLLGMRLMDQNFLDKVYNSKEPRLEVDEVYLHDRRTSIKMKISKGGESHD